MAYPSKGNNRVQDYQPIPSGPQHPLFPVPTSLTHLDLPVICRCLIELHPQLEADLRVLEGAVCFYGDSIPIYFDDGGRLGHAGHLPGSKTHT